jgi:hypothetical protein
MQNDLSPTDDQKILKVLAALLDGIEGYLSEYGDLKYWKPEAIVA